MRWLWRLVRWLAGLVVFVVLVLGILLTLLVLFDAQGSRLLVDVLVSEIVNHQSPPPIAEGLIPSGQDWMTLEPTSSKFTAVLRKRFPPGSSAQTMHDDLTEQGFGDEQLLPREPVCTRPDPELEQTALLVYCPPAPWQHSLHYLWGSALCHQDLNVLWSADARGRLTQIVGYYTAECL